MNANPIAAAALVCLTLMGALVPIDAAGQPTASTEPPPAAPPMVEEPCPKGKRGGAIGGIVVGSVFFWVLPMSIPVLITQTKKLKSHNRAMQRRRCQYAD